MPITSRIDAQQGELALSGRFTFSDSSEFRKCLTGMCALPVKTLAINLGELTFMDSSGLGMLMVALRECQTHQIALSLHQPRGDVKSLLEMTKSYERFTIVG